MLIGGLLASHVLMRLNKLWYGGRVFTTHEQLAVSEEKEAELAGAVQQAWQAAAAAQHALAAQQAGNGQTTPPPPAQVSQQHGLCEFVIVWVKVGYVLLRSLLLLLCQCSCSELYCTRVTRIFCISQSPVAPSAQVRKLNTDHAPC